MAHMGTMPSAASPAANVTACCAARGQCQKTVSLLPGECPPHQTIEAFPSPTQPSYVLKLVLSQDRGPVRLVSLPNVSIAFAKI